MRSRLIVPLLVIPCLAAFAGAGNDAKTATLVATLLDPHGRPVARQRGQITVPGSTGAPELQSAWTDAQGRFTMEVPVAATSTALTFFVNGQGHATMPNLYLAPGRKVPLNVRLNHGAPGVVLVSDAALNKPMSGVLVRLMGSGFAEGAFLCEDYADGNGACRFDGLPAGVFAVSVSGAPMLRAASYGSVGRAARIESLRVGSHQDASHGQVSLGDRTSSARRA